MGNLRDQLLKAGLVDKKAAKKAAHDQRIAQQNARREGHDPDAERRARVAAEDARQRAEARQAELDRVAREKAEREAQAAAERHRELEAIAARESLEATRRARQAAKAAALELREGPIAVHFVRRDGGIDCLRVTNTIAVDLFRGRLAIVELPGKFGGDFGVVRRDVAENLRTLDADVVRFFNREPTGDGASGEAG